jgi:glycosyl transferase family 87
MVRSACPGAPCVSQPALEQALHSFHKRSPQANRMTDPLDRASHPLSPDPAPEKGWPALVALVLSTIFGIVVAVSARVYYSQAPGVDFASFWAAGHLVLSGNGAAAYDPAVHRAVEATVVNIGGLLPFSYPPPFLLLVAPFAFRPFWLAYLLWIGVTGGLYFLSTRPLLPPRYAFAHPAAVVNAMIGQNGLLTTGLLLLGAALLAQYPFAGGAVLGLLIVKPQLACLVPVALLAGREWRAIAGAAATSLSLIAIAWLVFGIEAYRAFAASAGDFAGYMAASRWKWGELASMFGLARSLGAPQSLALALQALAAVGAAIVTWRAWAMKRRERVAILAAATLLVPPYLFTYDSMLLIAPLAWFLGDKTRPWRAAVLWILLLLPLGGYFHLYPNVIPLAAILSLWWLHSPEPRTQTIHKREAAAPLGTTALP